MTRKIIDLSEFNGSINWNTLKKNVDGIIFRVAYRGYSAGNIKRDSKANVYLAACKQYNIPFSIYFMSQAITTAEAIQEAQYCIDFLKGSKVSLPVYFDSEMSGAPNNSGRADGLSKETRTACVIAFCNKLIQSGYKAGVYASTSWFTSRLIPEKLRAYEIWVAQYASKCTLTALPYGMWQYTSKGSVSGITGNVDISHCYKDYDLAQAAQSDSIEVKSGVCKYSLSTDGNRFFLIDGKKSNFRVREFACKDGSDEILIDGNLVCNLQKIRDHFGKALTINSGYRNAAYNKKIGGASGSYHVKGQAADIVVSGISTQEVAKYAQTIGIKGIGWYNYANGFVHVDTRTVQYFWRQDSANASYYQVSSFIVTSTSSTYQIKQWTVSTVRQGDKGETVKFLQQLLNAYGKYGLSEDGIFGTATKSAVMKFQTENKLVSDGIAGKNTWTKLLSKY